MSEKLYRLVLLLYPERFRGRYGDEALQLFRDRLRDERGFSPRLRLWLDLLRDTACSLPVEYRRVPSGLASAQLKPPGGFPSFPILETERLRRATCIFGILLALFELVAIGFLINHGRNSTAFQAVASETPQRPEVRLRTVIEKAVADLGFSRSHGGNSTAAPQELKLDKVERRRVVEAVIADLNEYYADRDAARRAADLLRTEERDGSYEKIDSGTAFAGLLTRQLRSVTGNTALKVVYSGDRDRAGMSRRIDGYFSIDIPRGRTIGSR